MSRANDALSDALAAMRVSGTLLLNECYEPPWGLSLPAGERLAAMFGVPGGTRVVAFHMVVRGAFDLALDDEVTPVVAGEVAICFGGGEHTMAQGAPRRVVSLEEHLAGRSSIVAADGATELVCGVFLLRDTRLNPLYRALPPLAVAKATDRSSSLAPVMHLLVEETRHRGSGSAFMSERIVEMLLAEVVRAQLAGAPASGAGWFSALRDERIARVLDAVHGAPGQAWTVEQMAQLAGLSRARFAGRFGETVGESPMRYLARWRMNLATRLLREGSEAVSEVAYGLGYESLAAFSRAFKREVGVSPARWRGEQRGAA